MKKNIFRIFLVISTVSVIVSCSKDQKAVKDLEGDWEEVAIDGEIVPDSSKGTMTFEYCKLKKDEWCEMYYTEYDGSSSGIYYYKVTNKGEYLTQKIEDPSKGTIEISGNINELTDDKLVLEMNFLGIITTTEYKKK